MKLPRRKFLRVAASAGALPLVSQIARAQPYPTRPVRLIEGIGVGATTDLIARLMGKWVSERLGTPFIIENRSGANGNIAAELVARASPDGYTLLLVNAANTINATLYPQLNFDFIRDIAPVASIARGPLVMEVNPSVPVKTVPEFIEFARANPGKINMASAGTATATHVVGELFMMMADVNLLHVPFRGSQAILALLAGQVDVMFFPIPAVIEYTRAGRLRALAVTTATRSEALPYVPTVAEFLPGFEASSWWGVGAPRGTPTEIIGKLNREINAGLADPNIKQRLAEFGGTPVAMTAAEFGTFIGDDAQKWAKVIRAANIKPD